MISLAPVCVLLSVIYALPFLYLDLYVLGDDTWIN